ncbi:PqqD family peptide modification chaperone [Sphingomonas bacterium]|uniref:PqqD family peptide modification chaperone n=1 Tax=Sphingomonas bacterium TaxID=1895847 RepID=UPI00261A6E96|nr:PqqD family peptide modification chaperone [Sphingomonas bacterium]MDB5679099.1 PqqD family protein [Sphingomonas bacterium]
MNVETIYRDGDWLSTRVGDDLVMMSAAQGNYLRLSEVGARVWELLEQPRSRDDLHAVLVAEYDVAPEVCRAAIDEFLATLADRRAVRID